jgi:hypothetical protein
MNVATRSREMGIAMANSIDSGSGGVDEIRYRSYLNQLERDQDAQIKDKEDTHREHLAKVVTTNDDQMQNLRKDYDVKISDEADALERKLSLIRERNGILSNQERENGEREADKVHNQYASKIEQEKKIGDDQISRLQAYYKRASDELHKNFEKEREKTMTPKGRA